MARRISMATRTDLIEAIIERYRSSCRADKRRILDEFVAVTGYHRKHAIRVLRHRESEPPSARQYAVQYGPEVREALVVLWEASDRLCSRRLKPLIPILLPALECHGATLHREPEDSLAGWGETADASAAVSTDQALPEKAKHAGAIRAPD